ncbi:hypothetical protein [Clostridium tagluense]|uniref:Uncharacterized protein n=1 Tax=Clostridium tagluense TaxID=360422 RepID=A0A401UUP6_9CLOT|nr:hypothetical protein [Clostridium tagluense]GCD13280.1 hypothetical protein Ctaglu_49030 [Clostridium tagluense]
MSKATWLNIGGVWKQAKNIWENIGGVWKQKVIPKGNISGLWKDFIGYYTPRIFRITNRTLYCYSLVENKLEWSNSTVIASDEIYHCSRYDPVHKRIYVLVYDTYTSRSIFKVYDALTGSFIKASSPMLNTTYFDLSEYGGGRIYWNDEENNYIRCTDLDFKEIWKKSTQNSGKTSQITVSRTGKSYSLLTGGSSYSSLYGVNEYGSSDFNAYVYTKVWFMATNSLNELIFTKYEGSNNDLMKVDSNLSTQTTLKGNAFPQMARPCIDDSDNIYLIDSDKKLSKYSNIGTLLWSVIFTNNIGSIALTQDNKITVTTYGNAGSSEDILIVDPTTGGYKSMGIGINLVNTPDQFNYPTVVGDRGLVGAFSKQV